MNRDKKECPSCGKMIKKTSKMCRSCSTKNQWRDAEQRRTKIAAIKKAQPPKERGNCIDCGKKLITLGALRCKTCNAAVVKVINTGIKRGPYSAERRAKIASAAKERFKNQSFREMWRESLKGNPIYNKREGHPTWKGGERKRRDRTTGEYEKWRTSVFERDGYTCRMCGARHCVLNAHHILSYKNYPLRRYDINNGKTLCIKCHRLVHKTYYHL